MPSNHAELPFIAYSGDEPFLFVSYSHADSEAVYDELRWLHSQGVNIWYDEGISPGQTWPRELAGTLSRCSLVVIFISRHTLDSANCLREVHFAVERDKPILAVQVPGPLVHGESNLPSRSFMQGFFGGVLPRIELAKADAVPGEMVTVNASTSPLIAFNLRGPVQTSKFLIDRYETTNAQYQEFVDAGGYGNAEFWEDLEFDDGDKTLDWQTAISRFKDTTGRPGPSNWALGRFPDGAANLPVHGISWYEAMAYARFRGKTLPPFHYWVRATVALAENVFPITPTMVTQSNFSGQLVEVGSSGSVGPYGTSDTAGNVAEWIYNTSGKNRMVMGGSAIEPPYIFYNRNQTSPWDRRSLIGIRGFRSLEPVDPTLLADVPAPVVSDPAQPMSEEAFENDVNSYNYVAFESDPQVEAESTIENGSYRMLSLRSGRGD